MMRKVYITAESAAIEALCGIVQYGFQMRVRVGRPVREVLRLWCGIGDEYITGSIRTVFLDGKPVDDIDSAVVREGACLALSGAMPGLVGAVMRRGSSLASFRGTITHGESGDAPEEKDGMIRIKLFNVIMKDLGRMFLEHGIVVDSRDLADFAARLPGGFWQRKMELYVDDTPVDPRELMKHAMAPGGVPVSLRCSGLGELRNSQNGCDV